MTQPHPLVFLVDVDNTLVDNDGIQQDLKDHLEQTYGVAARDRYWRILEDLMVELGYRDYIGALQNFRVEHPREIELLSMSSFLMDYPFAERLYPDALEVLKRLRSLAPTVILSDGDVVFQPRKVEHAGLAKVADGNVLIYIHKEEALEDVERRFPGRALRSRRRQAAHPGRGQAGLGRARDDRVAAPGPVCARRQGAQRLAAGGHHDRTHRGSARLRLGAAAHGRLTSSLKVTR